MNITILDFNSKIHKPLGRKPELLPIWATIILFPLPVNFLKPLVNPFQKGIFMQFHISIKPNFSLCMPMFHPNNRFRVFIFETVLIYLDNYNTN